MNSEPSFNQPIDFVLVTALPEERDALLSKLPSYRKLPPSGDSIRHYIQAEIPVNFPDNSTGIYQLIILSLLGMGRVDAATATADAIRQWRPRYVMLIGIAGGIAASGIKLGDILISSQIVDYELQKLTPDGPEVRYEVHRADPGLQDACNTITGENWQTSITVKRPGRGKSQHHIGPIASGDKVIAVGDVLKKYRNVWPKLIGVEMEAGGAAKAAFQSADRPGFFMVRCVSDLADANKDSAIVRRWRKYACDAAASYVIELLKSGPVPLSKVLFGVKGKQVELVLEGEFNEFTADRQHEIISVLATLLRIAPSKIRVLSVHPGSIVITVVVPDRSARDLHEFALTRDPRLMDLGVKSILVDGRDLVNLFGKGSEFPRTMFSYVYGQIPLEWRNIGHSKIFVAHSFQDQRKADLRSVLRRAFEPELTPYYADTELDVNHLLIKLARRIDVCRLFVADLSQINPNVMIELGIALGRNKKILLCGSLGDDFPNFLWGGISAIRYRDYKALEDELDRQKSDAIDSLLSPSTAGWCQLCRQLCSGRIPTSEEEMNEISLVVDDAPNAGFQNDFLDAVRTSLDNLQIKPLTLKDAEKAPIRTLCSYVQALRSSKLAIFRFVPGMSPLVPFLFGLSFGLETYPVVLTEKNSNSIPTDLQGFDRIDYQNYQDITTQLDQKLPSFLDAMRKASVPVEWMKMEYKTRDALIQIQNFLNTDNVKTDDRQRGIKFANEDKMQIALALGLYAIRCSSGSLMVKTSNNKLRIKALVAHSAEMDAVGEWREFDVNEGICGWVTRNKKPFLTGDRTTVNNKDISYARRSFDKNLVSLVCVPIMQNDEVVGVINADSREQDFFREADIEVLGIVANLLSPIVADEAHHFDNDDYSRVTQVESELQKGHVCMACGNSTVVMGFKRKEDEEGLRYRMYLRCMTCNHTDDIRTYILRSR